MKKISLIFFLFICIFRFHSQNTDTNFNRVKRYYYKDSIVSMEKWYGNDKKIDSFKTFHKTGKIDERFYYLNGRLQGNSYKYNAKGDNVTTWNFNNGRLVERIDHILEFNKKDEERVKKFHMQLKELNTKLIANPSDTQSRLHRAHIRCFLGDRILALSDLNWRKYRVIKIAERRKVEPSNKALASIYDRISSIYAHFEIKNYASHFMFKAVKSDPENSRLMHNLGAYLYTIKSYDLSKHYLNKALEKIPNHAFVHRVLAALYSDFEDYEKAKYHIDIAFPQEKSLLKNGFGTLENDIRTLRGLISHKLNNSKEGINDLKEAIKLNNNNSFAHRNLGTVYYDLGEYKLACEYLQKAKELGYEKIHDRDDLQAYLVLSCENAAILENKKETQSKVVLESEPIHVSKLSDRPFIYPNPTKAEVKIKNLPFKDYQYLIFDYTGKLVFQGASEKAPINISQLPTGIYTLKVINNDLSETFRVIKED